MSAIYDRLPCLARRRDVEDACEVVPTARREARTARVPRDGQDLILRTSELPYMVFSKNMNVEKIMEAKSDV